MHFACLKIKLSTIYLSLSFLDRHHAWRSLDPTLDIWSNFVKKEKSIKCLFFPFTSSVALVAMSQGFPKVTTGYQRLPHVTKGYYFNRFPKWISLLFSLVLPVLTDHYIKTL